MSSHSNPWLNEDPGNYLGPKHNKIWKPVVCAVHGLVAGGAFLLDKRSRYCGLLGKRAVF